MLSYGCKSVLLRKGRGTVFWKHLHKRDSVPFPRWNILSMWGLAYCSIQGGMYVCLPSNNDFVFGLAPLSYSLPLGISQKWPLDWFDTKRGADIYTALVKVYHYWYWYFNFSSLVPRLVSNAPSIFSRLQMSFLCATVTRRDLRRRKRCSRGVVYMELWQLHYVRITALCFYFQPRLSLPRIEAFRKDITDSLHCFFGWGLNADGWGLYEDGVNISTYRNPYP